MKGRFSKKGNLWIFLSMFWIGGMMACPEVQSDDLVPIPWTGKFPVWVVAHRGFSGAAPENTMAAFKKAMEVGSDMIECDVHLSRDGEVVVIHDDTLKRTTNGDGRVRDFTLRELKRLDAGAWFGAQFSGEKIPTLKQVLELTRGKIPLQIELKEDDLGQPALLELVDRSFQEVEKAGMLDQVLFSSFNRSAIERIREKNPNHPLALIHNKPWNSLQEITGGTPFPLLSCSGKVLNSNNASRARQQGVRILVWTLNTEEQMEHFLKVGVDGIVTNYPDRLINVLKRRSK